MLRQESSNGIPADATLHGLFEAEVGQAPDLLAAAYGGAQFTYAQLNGQANQLAARLRALGLGAEAAIGVYLERSLDHLVALLAVLKAGGAYLPLDPRSPPDRVRFMLDDASAPIIITRASLAADLAPIRSRLVCLDREAAALAGQTTRNPGEPITSDRLAYIFYTSGSTGRPKAVAVEHRGVINELLWTRGAFDITSADRATWLSSPTFAVSRWEVWPYLTSGASLHIAPDEVAMVPERLCDWLVAGSITITFVVTALAEQLWRLAWPTGTALRVMITGGERLRQWPPASLPFAVVNSYGVTETSGARLTALLRPATEPIAVGAPIGHPILRTRPYVLDPKGEPVTQGEPGELYVGGFGLARGYLAKPALTAERFVPDPFGDEPGARMYRTGDVVRWGPSGALEFLGRTDDQVKIRGVRVELGEIESALLRHAAVRSAVVVAREIRGEPRLIAYVTTEPDVSATEAELRAFLARTLPSYMLPAAIVKLAGLPVSPNGKINYRALPPVELGGESRAAGPRIAPRTAVEASLAMLWAEVLGQDDIGVLDDFFERGGDSLTAARLLSRIGETFGCDLPLADLFEHRTITEQARQLDQLTEHGAGHRDARGPRARVEPTLELTARVDELTDNELDTLLDALLAETEQDQ